MSNDRVYIKCAVCNTKHLLAKYWGGGEFRLSATAAFDRPYSTVAEFLQRHTQECANLFDGDLGKGIPFILVDDGDKELSKTCAPPEKVTG